MEEITMLILCNLIRSPKHTSYFGVHQGCDGFDPSPDGFCNSGTIPRNRWASPIFKEKIRRLLDFNLTSPPGTLGGTLW
jgi:hypothetical protein